VTQTYGTATLKGATWHVEAQPHVAMLLKRWFKKGDKGNPGKLKLSNTLETCRDLEWFSERYPLQFEPEAALRDGAARHRSIVERIAEYSSPDFHPRAHAELRIQPRTYQSRSAEICRAAGSLLCADELGLGKQQPVDSKVLTPSGYRPIGDLMVGDYVIGSSGKPVIVTGVYPQGLQVNYRVTFSDESSVEAGLDHIWAADYLRGGRSWARLTFTTRQLMEDTPLRHVRASGQVSWMTLSKTNLYLPMLSGPVEFSAPPLPLPVPPYTLGALIANGSMAHTNVALTVGTKDWQHVRSMLLIDGLSLGACHAYGGATRCGVIGLRPMIRALGLSVLSKVKRIPRQYMLASITERKALLCGLMDGDGSISPERNRISYHTTSEVLAEDVRELVEGLGGVASIRCYDRKAEDKGLEFQVRVRVPPWIQPFTLPRKLERYQPKLRTHPVRTFKSVVYSRAAESVCIAVDAPDQLYVTEHAILTHNTCTGITLIADPACRPAVVVPPVHLQRQWAAECIKFAPGLVVHIIKSTKLYQLPTFFGNIPDVVICPYSKLAAWAQVLAQHAKSVIFDECQELRRSGTPASPSQKYNAATLLAHAAQWKLGLSATPVFNYGSEIHNVYEVLARGRLGEHEEFVREWCKPWKTSGGQHALRDPRAFGSYLREVGLMVRHTRREVGRELPPVISTVHTVDADEERLAQLEGDAAALARTILRDVEYTRGEKMNASEELSVKLRQAIGIAKAPYVVDFVRLLVESGEQVLLAGWHREVYGIWAERFKQFDIPVCWYTGSESPNQKEESKRRFVAGEDKVMMISLRSGAGLDGLQERCNVVVIGELDWSPAVHEQLIGRLHRDGQQEPVLAYFLVADTGADPIMCKVLGLKKAQVQGIREPHAPLATPLSSDGADRMKSLAADYLRRRGLGPATPGQADANA